MINNDLCEPIQAVPPGANVRRWTLRADNQSHHHSVVRIDESPLYLELSYRLTASSPVVRVEFSSSTCRGFYKAGLSARSLPNPADRKSVADRAYQICHKWLKDRRESQLIKDDITHYKKIISSIKKTIHLMGEIDEVIEEHGGLPIQ